MTVGRDAIHQLRHPDAGRDPRKYPHWHLKNGGTALPSAGQKRSANLLSVVDPGSAETTVFPDRIVQTNIITVRPRG
jgi:hypothetical protein